MYQGFDGKLIINPFPVGFDLELYVFDCHFWDYPAGNGLKIQNFEKCSEVVLIDALLNIL